MVNGKSMKTKSSEKQSTVRKKSNLEKSRGPYNAMSNKTKKKTIRKQKTEPRPDPFDALRQRV